MPNCWRLQVCARQLSIWHSKDNWFKEKLNQGWWRRKRLLQTSLSIAANQREPLLYLVRSFTVRLNHYTNVSKYEGFTLSSRYLPCYQKYVSWLSQHASHCSVSLFSQLKLPCLNTKDLVCPKLIWIWTDPETCICKLTSTFEGAWVGTIAHATLFKYILIKIEHKVWSMTVLIYFSLC